MKTNVLKKNGVSTTIDYKYTSGRYRRKGYYIDNHNRSIGYRKLYRKLKRDELNNRKENAPRRPHKNNLTRTEIHNIDRLTSRRNDKTKGQPNNAAKISNHKKVRGRQPKSTRKCNTRAFYIPSSKVGPIAHSIQEIKQDKSASVTCIYVHYRSQSMETQNNAFTSAASTPTNTVPTNKSSNPISKLLTSIFFCCLGRKESKGFGKVSLIGDKCAPLPTSPAQADVRLVNLFVKSTHDFTCQYAVKSNQSLEIISHMLSKSVSQHSTMTSSSDKLRQQIQAQKSSLFHIMKYKLGKNSKDKSGANPNRNKKHNVVILPVPKKFSNTSTDTVSTNRNSTKFNTSQSPLFIKDKTSDDQMNDTCVVKPKKIWGPGEVL